MQKDVERRCPSLQLPGTLSKRSQTKEEIRKLNVKKIRKEVIKLPSIADVIIFK